MSKSVSLELTSQTSYDKNEPVLKAGNPRKAYLIVAGSVGVIAAIIMSGVALGWLGLSIAAACTGIGLPFIICGIAAAVFAASSAGFCIGMSCYSFAAI